MKKNYTFKTIKKGIVIMAILAGFTKANAQTETEYATSIRPDATILTYPNGAANFISDEITKEGVTFKLQLTATPSGNENAFIGNATNRRFGVGNSTDETNPANLLNSEFGDMITFNTLEVIDFNDNGTGYTEAAISKLNFKAITIRGGHGAADNASLTVDGATNAGTFELGQLATVNEVLEFGVEYTNQASTPFTIGSQEGDITTVTATNGATDGVSNFQLLGLNVGYTFTTNATASIDDNVKNDTKLKVFPTITDGAFSVNKEFKTLQLFDLTGKTIKIFNATDVLEVSGLNQGLYIVKIKSVEGAISTSKMIVK
ncbi:T9SS type A sorting domain-containing protein [Polaribacter sp. Asnod6-C07]|uniref:T9SS type A sorting domain-containing protein n=1 Tax=Polaribacter sp. Asnod6-C07 TaxID=3160582 RepID=UPI00386EBF5A